AGEAGMGFAVVADEVRNLAQRSAQAARDTTGLIEESVSKANNGRAKVGLVTEQMSAIAANAAQVKTLVDEVNLGSAEQARGIEQVARAVAQMEKLTQNSAASAEEGAAAAQDLNSQSAALEAIIRELTALVGGADGGSVSRRRLPAPAPVPH